MIELIEMVEKYNTLITINYTQGGRGRDTKETEGPTMDEHPRGRQVPGRRPRAERGERGCGTRRQKQACGAGS